MDSAATDDARWSEIDELLWDGLRLPALKTYMKAFNADSPITEVHNRWQRLVDSAPERFRVALDGYWSGWSGFFGPVDGAADDDARWSEIDELLWDGLRLPAMKTYMKAFNADLSLAITDVQDRWQRLVDSAPERFRVALDGYWSGFYS